jgi:general secretion pathway protein L
MFVLAVLLNPARPAGADAPGPASSPAEWDWVLSSDGAAVAARGRCGAATLPAADTLVLVLGAALPSWHRVDLPQVPLPRLRAAIDGLLEDAWLDEPAQLHVALEPGAAPGRPAWVAVLRRDALAPTIAALEAAGRAVDRVVAACEPGPVRRGHFSLAGAGDGEARLAWAGPDGVVELPLRGTLAQTLRAQDADRGAAPAPVWTATPAAAAAAERWLGAPVAVLDEGAWALQAAQSGWDLRQFDLAPGRRATRQASAAWRAFLGPAWRPVRIGLASLMALQVFGLNAWAWQQQRAIEQRKQAQSALLKSAHPQVRTIVDAPLQMQRETALLRARAGQVGEADLEAAWGAAAASWPEGAAPAQALRYEGGRLLLTVAGWSDPQQRAFRERLRAAGWMVDVAGSSVTIRRASAAAGG